MRTRYTVKDENHAILREFMQYFCGGYEAHKDGRTTSYTANYRGHLFIAHDTANYGGMLPDYILECKDTQAIRWVEVKSAGAFKKDGTLGKGELKSGESWLADRSDCWRLIVSDDDVKNLFDEMIQKLSGYYTE